MDFGLILDTLIPTSGGLGIIRAILGVILVFFLPGFAWSLVIFKNVNIIERIAISIGISIAMTTLVILVLNVLFNMKITGISSLVTIIVLTIIPAAIYLIRRLSSGGAEVPDGD